MNFVNIQQSWNRIPGKRGPRTILWVMLAYNLNGFATEWLRNDTLQQLAYEGSSQKKAAGKELGYETAMGYLLHLIKSPNNDYHVSMTTTTFQQMVQELTGKRPTQQPDVERLADDQRFMDYEGGQLTTEQQKKSRVRSPSPALGGGGESDYEDLTGGKTTTPGGVDEIPETPPQKAKVWPNLAPQDPETFRGGFIMSKDEERKKLRQKDEKKQDSMLVYGALACVGLAGVVYYG